MIPSRSHDVKGNTLGFFIFPSAGSFFLKRSVRRWCGLLAVCSVLLGFTWVWFEAQHYPHKLRDRFLSSQIFLLVSPAILGRNPLKEFVRAKLEPVELLNIDIPMKSILTLNEIKGAVLAPGLSAGAREQIAQSGDVSATAVFKDSQYRIKIRGKGQGYDHWVTERPSYRLAVKSNAPILGMMRFALMDPKRRGYLHEWVVREAFRREGIISKRMEFVSLAINNLTQGIYAVDQHFDSHLAEQNKRPDSVFVFFKNDYANTSFVNDDQLFITTYRRYQSNTFSEGLAQARYLLNGFISGDLPVSEAFDDDLFAKYFALADIFDAWHGLGVFNLRFYFNPITRRLEPAPDDNFNERVEVSKHSIWRLEEHYGPNLFINKFFRDQYFVQRYLTWLDKFTDPAYLERFWSEVAPELEQLKNIIRKNKPLFDFQYRAQTGGLKGILKNHGVGIEQVNFKAKFLRERFINFIPNKNNNAQESGHSYAERGSCGDGQNLNELGVSDSDLEGNRSKEIQVKKGVYRVNQKLILIPPNCVFSLSPGTEIELNNGSWIISSGAIIARGTADDPVRIVSNKTGANSGGILVMNTMDRSILENVVVSGLSNIAPDGHFLNGGITFYRADVDILSSLFSQNIAGDDVLNIIASDFSIRDSEFFDSWGDAFDSDFSTGTVENVRFSKIGIRGPDGGDALDFSASQVRLSEISMSDVDDKGISVGENSEVIAREVSISRATNGIVVKDGSEFSGESVSIFDTNVGLASIRKKKGYSSARMEIKELKLNEVGEEYILDKGFSLQIDGNAQTPNTGDGKKVIYK